MRREDFFLRWKGEKRKQNKKKSKTKKRERGKIFSCFFPEAELFITLSLLDRSEFHNKIFPNRALSVRFLIVGRKMTPILSKNRDDVTVSPITATQLPYLPSPQTPSTAFS